MTTEANEESAPLEVDRESLLELARGSNLYQTRFAFVRELVQNAIDATLLRAFAEHGPERFPTNESSLAYLRELLAGYPIDIVIERIEGGPGDEKRTYRVVVEDRGIGIHRDDVKHMQRTGSSRKNPRRARLIEEMPEWMRPSGTFGIGLQSVFLVARELTLDSRPLEGEPVAIRISTEAGGRVYVRASDRGEPGTRASLALALEGSRGNVWSARATMGVRDWLDVLDRDEELDGAVQLVRAMALGGLVPLRINGEEVTRERTEHLTFDPVTLIELYLPTEDGHARDPATTVLRQGSRSLSRGRGQDSSYRGAPLEEIGSELISEVDWQVGFHFGSARDVLMLGRDAPSVSGRREMRMRLLHLLDRRLPMLLESIDPKSRCAAWYSVYLLGRGLEPSCDAWRRVHVGRDGERFGEGRLVSLDEIDAASKLQLEPSKYGRHRLRLNAERSIRIGAGKPIDPVGALFPGIEATDRGCFLVREPGTSVTDGGALYLLREPGMSDLSSGGRAAVPVPDSLSGLSPPAVERREPSWERLMQSIFTLGPWVVDEGHVTTPRLPRLVRFTAETRGEGPETHRAIAELWSAYLERFDPVLRERDDLTFDYELEDALAQLAEIR